MALGEKRLSGPWLSKAQNYHQTCDPLSRTVAVVVNWHSALSTSSKLESFSIAALKEYEFGPRFSICFHLTDCSKKEHPTDTVYF